MEIDKWTFTLKAYPSLLSLEDCWTPVSVSPGDVAMGALPKPKELLSSLTPVWLNVAVVALLPGATHVHPAWAKKQHLPQWLSRHETCKISGHLAKGGLKPSCEKARDGHGAPERNNLLTRFVSFDVAEQKNPYQMMTKGGTMAGCTWACRRTRLPWLPVRRKLHPKSTKTSYQCFGESCLCAEDFDTYTAFRSAREIRAPKNPNCCKFQLRVKLKVERSIRFL
ncbi:hypothetical protein DV515_00009179 [Chloebia gouldiae]|uniref:Uncharacterized protein n=1 Tax=Chloebia gouldiae TaxID=44316 RepID=A0A3L8SDZ1_CHLGU|nr:hypothetical protein DV515_00009179 [Chloebia gouldiae]